MERYIARQPIFDVKMRVYAYELLYRGGACATRAVISDGDSATRSLLSDAITVFGLHKLTNSKQAFVNFTEGLIISDFVLLANPNEVAVEVLETIEVSEGLIQKLYGLKEKGYQLALDDYVGDPRFEPILPLIDILKVDFRLTDFEKQREIARRFRKQKKVLLAEKVETQAEFNRAADMGYSLFQGYFFEKPTLLKKRVPSMAESSYGRLLREVIRAEIDLESCAAIIHADATLTYQLLRKVSTLHYYRGNSIRAIKLALVALGTDELRRWATLLLARGLNVTCSDELVRAAYLRGVFTEQLMERSFWRERSGDGFLMGMMSLLDRIVGASLVKILKEIPLSLDVEQALMGRERNVFSSFLEFVLIYEMKNPGLILPPLELDILESSVPDLYMKCIMEADLAFES